MILYIKYDFNSLCKKILQEQFEKLNLKYSLLNFGEVEINEPVAEEQLKQLQFALDEYSIEIVEHQQSIMVQKIKDAIREMVFMEGKIPLKTSSFLADKLNLSYGYLSNVFSTVTYTSIENFILHQKAERAKQLLATNELTITEIGWKLNYSSTAHFSTQFKNITGLTPSAFQRIINKKRNRNTHEQ